MVCMRCEHIKLTKQHSPWRTPHALAGPEALTEKHFADAARRLPSFPQPWCQCEGLPSLDGDDLCVTTMHRTPPLTAQDIPECRARVSLQPLPLCPSPSPPPPSVLRRVLSPTDDHTGVRRWNRTGLDGQAGLRISWDVATRANADQDSEPGRVVGSSTEN